MYRLLLRLPAIAMQDDLLATVTCPDLQEQLQQLVFRGEDHLDDPHHTLRSGFRGFAQILVSHYTSAW